MAESETTADLYPITYRCPGGLSLTYNTTIPSYPKRLRHTLVGGLALWRMWLREMLWLLLTGQAPYPKVATQNVAGDINRVFRRLKWEALVMSADPQTTDLDEDLIEVAAMAIWEEYPAPLPAYASIPELSLEEVSRGDLRRMACAAVRAYLGRELMCECGAMSEDDCNDLPSLRHCGGATQTTAVLLEIARLARELVATADLSEPRGVTTTVSSDHLAELMEALEDAETHG